MATLASEVFDLFLAKISDHRLSIIYQNSGSSALNIYLEPWLLRSIDELEDSAPSLEITYDEQSQSFSTDLSRRIKNILAEIMVKQWLQKEVQDIMQMNNILTDRDFKTYSMANAYKSKLDAYNAKREEISQILIDYGLRYEWDNLIS